jgi:hypothetical protein
MQPERWQYIVGNIKDNFEILESDSEHCDDEGGVDIEYIVFKSPMGKVRLEYISKPVILDKKTIYSNRIGSETKVDYVYSQDEKSYKMMAYKWNDSADDWEEISADNFLN